MPLPPPTFTKTKWLAFFADLVAKVTHHNVLIVLEACEVIKRLLSSRVSVAAFLEQGDLLQHLLDTVGAVVRCQKTPTELDAEMLFSLLQVLRLMTDMMLALYADGDEYYTLLVVSRSVSMVSSLVEALKNAKNLQHFGAMAAILKSLLSLPLCKKRKALVVEEGVGAINHIRVLEESLGRASAVVQELHAVTMMLAMTSTGATHTCAQYLTLVAGELGKSAADANVSSERSALNPDGAHELVTREGVEAAYTQLAAARSHSDCFDVVNSLQCYRVVSPSVCAAATGAREFSFVARFFQTRPSSTLDFVLFRMLCGWFHDLVTTQGITPELRAALLGMVHASLLPMLIDAASSAAKVPVNASISNSRCDIRLDDDSIIGSAPSRSEAQNPGLARASVLHVLLTFFAAMEPAASEDHVEEWVKGGLLGSLQSAIGAATAMSSILVDAPSTVDGSISDEAYLQCALKSCRTETGTVAIVAMKFLAAIITNRGQLMDEVFPEEMLALAQGIAPLCMKIAVNNPSLSVADPGTIASVVHHIPRCSRASRATSVGECAVVLLDAVLAHCGVNAAEVVDPISLARWIPAVSRATRNSVHPPLRSCATRLLLRMSSSPAHLVMIVRELPSCLPSATSSVLQHTSASPPWEAAASAELLAHFLCIASNDAAVERSFSMCETALPLQLLKLVAATSMDGITYPTTALMTLLGEVWEQQRRLGPELGIQMYPAVAPNGRKSMALWAQVIEQSTNMLQCLSTVLARMKPIRAITSDGLARSLSTFEDVSVQCAFASATARGLHQLLNEFPDYREDLPSAAVIGFISACFAVQLPAEMALLVGQRFSVSVSHPPLLQRTFEDMINWASELGALWYGPSPTTVVVHAPVEERFLQDLARVTSTPLLSHFCKGRVALLLNAMLRQQGQRDFAASIAPASRELFAASLVLRDCPHVHAVRSRLLASYPAACAFALSSGWVHRQAKQLGEIVASLNIEHRLSVLEHEQLTILISLLTSCIVCDCDSSLANDDAAKIIASMLILIRHPATRMLVMRFARAIANSLEGRRVLLLEVASSDLHSRTMFAKLLSLAISGKLPPAEAAVALDAVSTAVGLGGESFALSVVKLKLIEVIEGVMFTLVRQRASIPVGLFRFLAAASLSAHVQPAIARRAELLTTLVETAQPPARRGEHGSAIGSTTERSVLALMVLRNLCFHHACKTQMCQDSRIMLLFRNDIEQGTATAVTEAQFERLELSLSALWALIHNNQRGRAYVRGLLRQAPAISLKVLQRTTPKMSFSSPALGQFDVLVLASISALEDCCSEGDRLSE